MYQPQPLKKVDIFVSSPSDVKQERQTIGRIIELLNRMLFIPQGILLYVMLYEELVPPVVGDPAQIIVDRYMQEPDECFLLICVMWQRMGTPFTHPNENKRYQSGTEYEFMKAYEANTKDGTPHILLYRRVSDTDPQEEEQFERVTDFFDKFVGDKAKFKGLFQEYKSLREFERAVQIHIADILRKNPPDMVDETITRPTMIEEDRRLDVALPKATQIDQPTELWVQLCVENSSGFRDELSQDRTSEFDLSQEDIIEQPLGVLFPLNPKTQKPEHTIVSVEVVAPDFGVSKSELTLNVIYGKNTAKLAFSLMPKVSNPKSIVHVYLKQTMPEGVEIVLGTNSLYTNIASQEASNPEWSFVRRSIQALRLVSGKRRIDAMPLGKIKQPGDGASIGREIVVEVQLQLDETSRRNYYWIAVRVNGLLWPQKSLPSETGEFSVSINVGRNLAIGKLSIVLLQTTEIGNQRIHDWFAEGGKTLMFLGLRLNEIPNSKELDSLDIQNPV